MKFRILQWGLVILALSCGLVFGETVRLAVAGDPALADQVDMISAQLATDPSLALLDRADLNKVGAEQALQSAVGGGDLVALSVVPADGLVLLRSTGVDGKTGVFARLVAVEPGVVLREVALPDAADPAARAKAVAMEFAPYWTKLACLRQGGVTAFSLLGLRFDVDAPARRPLERQFNMLLASRLGAEPDCLVLERWRLNDALFEKSLHARQSSPFWTGSSLIDGSLEERDGQIVAKVRVRSPKAAEVTITDQDKPENLSDLIGRLAEKIRQKPAGSVAWKPADEAGHFARLGQWCLDNRLFVEGTEAIESALALGDASRTTHMLQVKAYALQAYPDDLRSIYPGVDNFRVANLDLPTMPQRVAAATRAVELAREYLKANADFIPGPKWNPEDPLDLSVKTFNTGLRLLCAAYEAGFQHSHPDDAATLRHALQPLITELGAKLEPAPLSLIRADFMHFRAYYAGLWNVTPEESLTFYRKVLKSGEIDGAGARGQIFQPGPPRQPFLDKDDGAPHPVVSAWANTAAPWIVAWNDRTPEQLQELWGGFIKQLAASQDLLDQSDAMKFEACSYQTEAARDKVGVRYVDFIEKHPEILSGPQKEQFCAGVNCLLRTLNYDTTRDLRVPFVQFNADLMHKHALLSANWIQALTAFVYGPHSDESAPILLDAVNDYSAWYATQKSQDGDMVRILAALRDSIYSSKPKLVPAESSGADALTISQFWKPECVPGEGSFGGWVLVDPRTLALDGRNAWVITLDDRKIVGFDPATMKTVQSVPIPKDLVPRQKGRSFRRFLEASPDWLMMAMNGSVVAYPRGGGQWIKLDVPPTSYRPRWTGGQFYLLYNAEHGDRLMAVHANDPTATGSGLIRVTLPGGAREDLVSSRRVPAQTPLDGRPLGTPIDVWGDAVGLSVSFTDEPVFTTPAGKNEWTPRKDIPPVRSGKITSGGFLTEENRTGLHFGKLVLHGDGPERILLSDEGPAEWNMPKGLGVDGARSIHGACFVVRGSDLCAFALAKTGPNQADQPWLVYFTAGRKEAFCVPLSFDLSVINAPVVANFRPFEVYFDAVRPVDNGVLIPETTHRGFWLLPWADVDLWLAKAAPKSAGN